ncbi:GRIP and coiled-coil domain-containing protein 1 [Merluccius polli]|uniref:GRIP and coiled-coil domain-containing protein 1 n=1 Tax=Merluccius polli TaxID=89951 RepID=A0AA47M6K8_MERPO|nr:GRIP and coiled-coil domain-containing protein 1 [Merluccius polli]
MEKFGMSFGGGPSKKDMQDTIESQKKQLVQYQTRFKDVVRAYKSLLKEKEALEASLKVLTVSQEVDLGQHCDGGGGSPTGPASITSDLPDDRCSMHSEDSLDTAASITSEGARGEQADDEHMAPPGETEASGAAGLSPGHRAEPEASGSESGISSSSGKGQDQLPQQRTPPPPAAPVNNPHTEADRRVLQLRTQLSTLTSSLTTVTQEKSRMEASFQADKRNIKQELEELQARLEEERRQHEAQAKAMQVQLAESKARVITQQHDRAQEQGNHALMLRELQTLLQEERDLRQDAEIKLEDARAALLESAQAADRSAGYEALLRESSEQREEMRRSLQVAEAEGRKPDPRVEELQQEVAELKRHYQQQLQHEIKKAEERSRQQAQGEEGRVASLEERVSELSELLGSCEKAKQKDQQTIHRLRERLLQLDMENKTLAIAASTRVSDGDLSMEEANLDVGALKDKLERVKKLLLLASRRSPEQTAEIQRLSEPEAPPQRAGDPGGPDATEQQELRQLREEFERYKLRAQVVLKNKNTKDGCQAKELEEARDQLAELKEKYINLRIHKDEADAQHRRDLEECEQRLAALQHGHRQELERAEAGHREGLLRLEAELHKQRERVTALLDEKDRELEKLRSAALSHSGQLSYNDADATGTRDLRAALGEGSGGGGANGDEEATGQDSAQEESEIIAQALRLAGSNEPALLLLYAEQLARREVEAGTLRRQKRQLEDDLHQLQSRLVGNGERHEEEVAELRLQLDKLLRDQGREGANLEYLKNVIYKFLTLQDGSGRQQTLGAILTILHFSPQEKKAVFKLQAQTWWPAGNR